MKLTKTSEIDPTRAYRVFQFIGGLEIMRDNIGRATYAVGTTHKSANDVKLLSRDFPVDILFVQRISVKGLLRLLPIPKPIKFIIKVNNPSCIADIVAKLDMFLLIGIYNFDSKLTSVFIECAKTDFTLGKIIELMEPDCSSLSYIVDFDNQESETGIMEYWIYGPSLASVLSLYV